MNIYIFNESTVLRDDEITPILPGLTVYTRHIRAWWGTMQPGLFFQKPLVPEAWQIIIADDSDQAGALGYHDWTPGGRPIGYVFAKTDMEYGYDWQITLTHELAEMLMDPYIARCEQTGNNRFHALELCDPVEADKYAYKISAGGHTIRVSDFITPLWFVPGSTGTFDHMNRCSQPLQILDGGYAYYWENGKWLSEDNFGQTYTPNEFAEKEPGKTRLKKYARDRE